MSKVIMHFYNRYHIIFLISFSLLGGHFIPGVSKAQGVDLFSIHEQKGGVLDSADIERILRSDSLVIPSYGCLNYVKEYHFFFIPQDDSTGSVAIWVTKNGITPKVRESLRQAKDGDIISFQHIKTTCRRNNDNSQIYDLRFACKFRRE